MSTDEPNYQYRNKHKQEMKTEIKLQHKSPKETEYIFY